ncbi:hypothetical protein VNO77_44231 [Canavalia gladiata]|uniref:Uncharacterized protein n=1 Tax=Canavalia gladiata TaxID=3824 RepID=A0AAN9PQT6_CANGL
MHTDIAMPSVVDERVHTRDDAGFIDLLRDQTMRLSPTVIHATHKYARPVYRWLTLLYKSIMASCLTRLQGIHEKLNVIIHDGPGRILDPFSFPPINLQLYYVNRPCNPMQKSGGTYH